MGELETERLILRRWRDSDLPHLAAVNADPDVMRWIGDGSTWDEDRTRDGIRRMEALWEAESFGLYAVEIRATGELAGFTGLSVPLFLPEVLPAVEIGWRLGRRHWGRGYATEAAVASLRYGIRTRGLDRVISVAQTGNTASERVMHKLGMRLDRELVSSSSGRPVRVYAITAEEYAAAAG
ncbi:GNAT family N-acetyltransferase [Streptomyces cocklensis]|jgi:RimJ/RimL family protein N-acetyltransferase|uniref:N-acetyltransferase n=1 Tax=Actinacidiphila cocklensis TaxID=887465 RepID=A0A9W4DTS4_9ACTN|nr:GNAT family N-acetyltransferase [Actinacidiphila cocklensis]MDD1062769.1 GNAT family N-acetyltransferase [Actinacidiphila cocklensis]WSX77006.1 GNAT family N-acetyltransferase [Streptomyces sp. NBC_00899]CAG6396047.1 N-acetyltransferase [Actinacidiphila cocklensis]